MKKTITLMAFLALGTLTMFSCKKSDNNTSSNGSMTAIVNGSLFAASRCYCVVDDTILSITGANYSGTAPLYPSVQLTIRNYKGAGVYTFADQNTFSPSEGSVDSSSDLTALYNTTSAYGTITVTGTPPNVTGTFNFTANDSTKVAGGTFTAVGLPQP